MEFSIIDNPSGVHPTKGYSHAVRMGDLMFVSGQVAQNQQGEIVGEGTQGADRADLPQPRGGAEGVLDRDSIASGR